MPIEVRHDVPFAASAGLAALAGTAAFQARARDQAAATTRQAMQLGRAADMQHQRIQAASQQQQQQIEAASAQAHQQAEYAKDRLGYQAGLQEELQEQKFEQAMEGMEQRAKEEASQWEWKQDIASKKRQNEARSYLAYLDTDAGKERFTQSQREELGQQLMDDIMRPSGTPHQVEKDWTSSLVDTQGNKVAPMQMFKNEDGGWSWFELSARGTPTRKSTNYKDTVEYFEITAQREQQATQMERLQKRRDAADEYASDLRTKLKETWEGSELDSKKPYEPKEIKELRDWRFPDVAAVEAEEFEERKATHRQKFRMESFLDDTQDVEVSPEDADLPIEQQKAQAVIRKVLRLKEYGRDVSRYMPLVQTAQSILKESQRSGQ